MTEPTYRRYRMQLVVYCDPVTFLSPPATILHHPCCTGVTATSEVSARRKAIAKALEQGLVVERFLSVRVTDLQS